MLVQQPGETLGRADIGGSPARPPPGQKRRLLFGCTDAMRPPFRTNEFGCRPSITTIGVQVAVGRRGYDFCLPDKVQPAHWFGGPS
jgi:hypothetical protein